MSTPLPSDPALSIEPRDPGTQLRITGIPFRYTGRLLDRAQNESAQTRLAFSVRKIYSRYTGPAFRVRRSLDNQEKDIGFNGTFLDEEDLLRFVTLTSDAPIGTFMGYVTRWYDQSGNQTDAIQPDPLFQPIIVENNRIVRDILGSPSLKFGGRFLDTSWEPTIDEIRSGVGATMVVSAGDGRQGQTGAIYLERDDSNVSATLPNPIQDPRIPNRNDVLRLETTPFPREFPRKMAYVDRDNRIVIYDPDSKNIVDTGKEAPEGSALLTLDIHDVPSGVVPPGDRSRGWKASVWGPNDEKLYLIPYDADNILVIDPSDSMEPVSSIALPNNPTAAKTPNELDNLTGWFHAQGWTGTEWTNHGSGDNVTDSDIRGVIEEAPEGAGIIQSSHGYLYGDINAGIEFPESVLADNWNDEYTIFHVCKYNGPRRGRIVNGFTKNWFSGFHQGKTGRCFHHGAGSSTNAWISRLGIEGPDSLFGDDWVISSDQHDLYRGNGETLDMSRIKNPTNSSRICLNSGRGVSYEVGDPPLPLEHSDWACAELITYYRKLSDAELCEVEAYLMEKYGPRRRFEDAILVGEKIYAVPSSGADVLVIDTTDNTCSYVPVPGYMPRSMGWRSMVASADGNKLYGIPYNADQVLRIQTGATPTVDLIGSVMEGMSKWRSGERLDTDHIFGIPSDAGTLLRITPGTPDLVELVGNTGTRIDPVPAFLDRNEWFRWVQDTDQPSVGNGYEFQAPRLRVSYGSTNTDHGGRSNPLSVGLPARISDMIRWAVNPDGTVSTTVNSPSFIGLLSTTELENYEFTCRLSAPGNNDNDFIGFIIAFEEDQSVTVPNLAFGSTASYDWSLDTTNPQIPMQHTLTVMRSRTNQTVFGVPQQSRFYIAYNLKQSGPYQEKFWLAEQVPNTFDNLNPTSRGYFGENCRLRVRREGDLIQCWTSNWTDELNPGEDPNDWSQWIGPLEINLDDYPELHRFKGQKRFGYGAWSQANATHSNTVLRDLEGNVIAFDSPFEFRPTIQFPLPDPEVFEITASFNPTDENDFLFNVIRRNGASDWGPLSGLIGDDNYQIGQHVIVFPGTENRYTISEFTNDYILTQGNPNETMVTNGAFQIIEVGTTSANTRIYQMLDELDIVNPGIGYVRKPNERYDTLSPSRRFSRLPQHSLLMEPATVSIDGELHGRGMRLKDYQYHEKGLSTEFWDYRPSIELGRGNDPRFGNVLINAADGSIATINLVDGGDGFFVRPELRVIGGNRVDDGSGVGDPNIVAIMAWVDGDLDAEGNPIPIDDDFLAELKNPISGTFDPEMPRPGWPDHEENDTYWNTRTKPEPLEYPIGREMKLIGIRIVDGGRGYRNSGSIEIIVTRPEDRINASVSSSFTDSRFVKSVSVLNGGSGYSMDTTVTIEGPTDHATDRVTATAVPVIENGVIQSIQVTHAGRNYGTTLPSVTITDPQGLGENASAIVTLVQEAYLDNMTRFDRPIPTGYIKPPATDFITTVTSPSRIVDSQLDSVGNAPARLCLRNERPGEIIPGTNDQYTSVHNAFTGRNKWTGSFVNESRTALFAIPENTCRVFCLQEDGNGDPFLLLENMTRLRETQNSPMPGGIFHETFALLDGWSGGTLDTRQQMVYCWPQWPSRTYHGQRNPFVLKFPLDPSGEVSLSPAQLTEPVVNGTFDDLGNRIIFVPENGGELVSIQTDDNDRLDVVRAQNLGMTGSTYLHATLDSGRHIFGTSRNGFQSKVLDIDTGSERATTLPPPRVSITLDGEDYLVFAPDSDGHIRRIQLGDSFDEIDTSVPGPLPTYTDATVLADGRTIVFVPTYNPYDAFDYTQGRVDGTLRAPLLVVRYNLNGTFDDHWLRTMVHGDSNSGVEVNLLPPLGSRSVNSMVDVTNDPGIFSLNTITWTPQYSENREPIVRYTINLDGSDSYMLPGENDAVFPGKRPMKRLEHSVQNVLQNGQTVVGTTYFSDNNAIAEEGLPNGTNRPWDVAYDPIQRKLITTPGVHAFFWYLDPFEWRNSSNQQTAKSIPIPTIGQSGMLWSRNTSTTGLNKNYRTIAYGANENLYMIPFDGDVLFEINAANLSDQLNAGETGGTTVRVFAMMTLDENKFFGAVAASNRRTFAVPFDADVILVIDPDQESEGSRIRNIDLPQSVLDSTEHSRYVHGVEANNGMLYFMPHSARKVLEVDPVELTCREVGKDLGAGRLKSYGGVMGQNGWIYGSPGEGGNVLVIDPTQRTGQSDGLDINVFSIKHPRIPAETSLTIHPSWSKPLMAQNGKIYLLPVSVTSALVLNPLYANDSIIQSPSYQVNPLDFFEAYTFGNFDYHPNPRNNEFKFYATAAVDNGRLYGIGRYLNTIVEVTPEMDFASAIHFRQTDRVEWISGPPLFEVFKLRPFVIWDEAWSIQSRSRVYLHTANGYGLLNADQITTTRLLTYTPALRIKNGYAGMFKTPNLDEEFTMINEQGIIKVEGNRGGFFGVRPQNGCDFFNSIERNTMLVAAGDSTAQSRNFHTGMFSEILQARRFDPDDPDSALYNQTGILSFSGQDPLTEFNPGVFLFVGNQTIGQGNDESRYHVGQTQTLEGVTIEPGQFQLTATGVTSGSLSDYMSDFNASSIRLDVISVLENQRFHVETITESNGTFTITFKNEKQYEGDGTASNDIDFEIVRLEDSKTPFSIGRIQGFGTSGNDIPAIPEGVDRLFLTSQYTGLISEVAVFTRDITNQINNFTQNQSFFYGVGIL